MKSFIVLGLVLALLLFFGCCGAASRGAQPTPSSSIQNDPARIGQLSLTSKPDGALRMTLAFEDENEKTMSTEGNLILSFYKQVTSITPVYQAQTEDVYLGNYTLSILKTDFSGCTYAISGTSSGVCMIKILPAPPKEWSDDSKFGGVSVFKVKALFETVNGKQLQATESVIVTQ